MRIIITGATGMVGEGVCLQAMQREEVSEIVLVARKNPNIIHPKVSFLELKDFFAVKNIAKHLEMFDACFFCLGVSSLGISKDEYYKLTYELTINFAETFLAASPTAVFTYVSGDGTSTKENALINWANVKGKTENALMSMGFRDVYCFRPGIMEPAEGAQYTQKTYKRFKFLMPVVRLIFKKSYLTLKELGDAMVNAVSPGFSKKILEPEDIRTLAHVKVGESVPLAQ